MRLQSGRQALIYCGRLGEGGRIHLSALSAYTLSAPRQSGLTTRHSIGVRLCDELICGAGPRLDELIRLRSDQKRNEHISDI